MRSGHAVWIGFCVFLLASGCDRATPTGPANGRNANPTSGTAASANPEVRLMRGPGEARYRLTMEGFNQLREKRVEQTAEFTLTTGTDGSDAIELHSASRVLPPARDPEKLDLDAACRAAFGGDSNVIARFAFTPTTLRKPNSVIPECASRDIFGIITDMLMFLSVQSREYGVDKLQAAGDRQSFGPFESTWTQPPDVLHGRIVCAGGEVILEKLEGGKAQVLWRPQPFDQGTIPTPRGAITRLMAGTETLALTLEIDTTTGSLLKATCESDELDLQGWSPFAGESVPDRKDWPKTSGLQMKAMRKLRLERIDPPAP